MRESWWPLLFAVATTDLEKEFKERLGWLVRPGGKRIRANLAAFANSPDTAIRALGKKAIAAFEARLAKVGQDQMASDLTLDWVPTEVFVGAANDFGTSLAKDRAVLDEKATTRELALLFEEACRGTPYGPAMLAPPPCRQSQRALSVVGRLEQVGRKRGEARARAALELLGAAFEQIYVPWALRLWILADLAVGTPSTPPASVGALIGRLSTRGIPAVLLVPDAVHIRNASRHERVSYDGDSRTLSLTDANGWNASLTTDEVEALVVALLDLDAAFHDVNSWFLIHAMHRSGVASAILAAVLAHRAAPNSATSASASAEIKVAEETLYGPPRRFVENAAGYIALQRLRSHETPLVQY